MNTKTTRALRLIGRVIMFLGVFLFLFELEWLTPAFEWNTTPLGLLLIAAGNALQLIRSEQEKREDYLEKLNRFEQRMKRFGEEKILLARQTSGVVLICLLACSIIVTLLGHPLLLWPIIGLIAFTSYVLITTSKPEYHRNIKRSNQSR